MCSILLTLFRINQHHRRRSRCKACGGSQICEHHRRRSDCWKCDAPKHPQHWCKLCTMVNVRCSRYDGYCYPCFAYSFPDDARAKRRIKVKEVALYKCLRATFPEVDITWDKVPQDGCTQRRPDLVMDLGYVVLVIECDEHAHRSSGYSCETKREMQLLNAYQRPMVIFRFKKEAIVNLLLIWVRTFFISSCSLLDTMTSTWQPYKTVKKSFPSSLDPKTGKCSFCSNVRNGILSRLPLKTLEKRRACRSSYHCGTCNKRGVCLWSVLELVAESKHRLLATGLPKGDVGVTVSNK